MKERIASQVTSVHNVIMLAALLGVGLTGSIALAPASSSLTQDKRVQSGKVEIFRGKGANRRLLGVVKPGGIFGEMSLIDNSPRMADAIAAETTVCLVIPPAAFREKLDKADPFIRALLRILVKNTRSMAEVMD